MLESIRGLLEEFGVPVMLMGYIVYQHWMGTKSTAKEKQSLIARVEDLEKDQKGELKDLLGKCVVSLDNNTRVFGEQSKLIARLLECASLERRN